MGRVFLLDDDEDVLDALGDLIAKTSALPCLRFRSLTELVREREPALACDLAILDIHLGTGQPSGLDAYEWLLEEHFTGRVAFLTGHAFSHPLVEQACMKAGARVFRKPIALADLRQLILEDN